MKLGIIGAMDSEVAALIAALDAPATLTVGGVTVHTGTLRGQDVAVVKCGIGKVCAAMCAQILIDRCNVTAIVNTGVAGGLGDGLAVGDLVVADAAVQHDFDITAFGHVRGYMPAFGGDDTVPSRWRTDPALSAAFRTAAETVQKQTNASFTCRGGIVASGDVFVDNAALKQILRRDFDAVAAEMEGAAIAQVAQLNGVPCAIVRAISDLADGSATVSFDTFEQEAAARSAAILLTMLENG